MAGLWHCFTHIETTRRLVPSSDTSLHSSCKPWFCAVTVGLSRVEQPAGPQKPWVSPVPFMKSLINVDFFMIDLLYILVEKSVRFPAWNQSIDDVVSLVLWYWVSYLLIWILHKSSRAVWYKCSWFWLRSGHELAATSHGSGGNQRKPTDQVNAGHVTWHVGYPPFRLPLVQPSSPNCRWFPRYFLPWGTAIHRRESTIASHPSTTPQPTTHRAHPCAASSASNPFGSLTFPAVYSSDKDGNFFATDGVGFCFLNLAAFVNGMMMMVLPGLWNTK